MFLMCLHVNDLSGPTVSALVLSAAAADGDTI